MHPSLTSTAHRPWPLATKPWRWRQSWHDLLFAHWPLAKNALTPLIPPEVTIQEYEGTAWVGVVPFRMSGVMRRPLPNLPWISSFPELNVRTYVEVAGKPGVWFFSLDATNPLAVWAARRFFHLPYFKAEMSLTRTGQTISYSSSRASARFVGEYRPVSPRYQAGRDTLEHWLTERYCLYAMSPDGRLLRNDVHHPPWPLQRATATLHENSMLESHGLPVQGPPSHLHFAERLDVVVWGAEHALL